MNYTTLSKSISNRLHTARWCAAFIVLLGHVEMVAKWRTGMSIWPWAHQMAHLAVVAFFVLSGFVIAHVSTHTSGLSAYIQERVTRIYSVLVPAVLLTILIDKLGGLINQDFYQVYTASELYMLRFIVNIIGLQGYQGHRVQFGTNSPLWSIGYEMFFYIIYGLIYYKVAKPGLGRKNRLLWGGAAFVFLISAGNEMASYLFIWLLGVLAYKLRKNHRLGGYGYILIPFIFYVSIGIMTPGYWQDLLFAIAVVAFLSLSDGNGRGIDVNKFFANFSYSLYAIHLPIIFFSFAVFWDDNLSIFLFASLVTISTVVVSFIFSLPFEKKRYVLRAYLKSILERISKGVKL